MVFIGYHASHEQVPPSSLLTAVVRAEEIGFDGAMCSDHLAPWGIAQGESGYAWTWLGAALASTSFSLGVVTAPGQRYHPVISAQAIATIEEMFPGRFWAAMGSGEAVNEHVTGDDWPPKQQRNARWKHPSMSSAICSPVARYRAAASSACTARECGAGPPRRRRCSGPR